MPNSKKTPPSGEQLKAVYNRPETPVWDLSATVTGEKCLLTKPEQVTEKVMTPSGCSAFGIIHLLASSPSKSQTGAFNRPACAQQKHSLPWADLIQPDCICSCPEAAGEMENGSKWIWFWLPQEHCRVSFPCIWFVWNLGWWSGLPIDNHLSSSVLYAHPFFFHIVL